MIKTCFTADKKFALCLLIALVTLQIQCSTNRNSDPENNRSWQSGDVYEDENGWTEARVGNMPLVISAPHGGTIKPESVPDRKCSGIVTVRDGDMIKLALAIEEELMEKRGIRPYLIRGHIARTKIDFNREIETATCGNEEVKATWHQYQDYIKQALADAANEHGEVLFIDLHGHGHDKQRLELGYALTKSEIRDAYLDENVAEGLVEESSLRNLLNRNSGLNLKQLLTGENAFGTLMEEGGIPAVPSLDDPYPLEEDPYFTGGYNTRRYTSSDYPKVFGWQIETNYRNVRDNEESIASFGESFSKSVVGFMEEHMEYSIN